MDAYVEELESYLKQQESIVINEMDEKMNCGHFIFMKNIQNMLKLRLKVIENIF